MVSFNAIRTGRGPPENPYGPEVSTSKLTRVQGYRAIEGLEYPAHFEALAASSTQAFIERSRNSRSTEGVEKRTAPLYSVEFDRGFNGLVCFINHIINPISNSVLDILVKKSPLVL